MPKVGKTEFPYNKRGEAAAKAAAARTGMPMRARLMKELPATAAPRATAARATAAARTRPGNVAPPVMLPKKKGKR